MDESGHAAESRKPSPEPSVGLDQTALDKAVLLEQIRVLSDLAPENPPPRLIV
jgi:hypothetical protein